MQRHSVPGAMPDEASDIWWPEVHEHNIFEELFWIECKHAGKSLKVLKSQFEKLTKVTELNQESAVDSLG